jgi:hypothetical protein
MSSMLILMVAVVWSQTFLTLHNFATAFGGRLWTTTIWYDFIEVARIYSGLNTVIARLPRMGLGHETLQTESGHAL